MQMKQIEKNTLNLANKLLPHDLIDKVYHPALPSFTNHHIWKRDFTGSSGLFAFSLKDFITLKARKNIEKTYFASFNTFSFFNDNPTLCMWAPYNIICCL